MNKFPDYMKRYFKRLGIFLIFYMIALVGGLSWMNGENPPGQMIAIGLAILTALPIIGVFWTIFQLLIEMDDEYQRFLMAKQILLATAILLGVTTIWQFLNIYDVVGQGPQWIGIMWLALFGVAGGMVRWKA